MIRIIPRLAAMLSAALLVLAGFSFRRSFAQAPSTTVVMTGAQLIDGTGRPPLEQAILVISNGRIEAVGASNAVNVSAGAVRVDMSGKTIMPGLINTLGHVSATLDKGSESSVHGHMMEQLRVYAAYGVTTVLSFGMAPADESENLKLRDELAHQPLDGARLYTGGLNAVGNTPEEARKSADRLADLKVDVIKFAANGTPKDMTPETYGAIIDEAHKRGIKTAVRLNFLKDAKEAVEKGVDSISQSVRDQDIDQALIAELKRRNVFYIPALTRDLSVSLYETTPEFFTDPFFLRGNSVFRNEVEQLKDPALQEKTRNSKAVQAAKQALQQDIRNLKILSDAGVQIAMGTDSGAPVGRWQGYFEHTELEMMVKAGMTPMQVIVSATGGAARAINLDKQLGTLEPGKMADLLVLKANPLTDIRNSRQIDSVWIGRHRLVREPRDH